MIAKYIQTGDVIDFTPTDDVAAGDVVVQGDLVGVAKLDIPTDKLGSLALTGVFEFPKATDAGTAMEVGTRVYWDASSQVLRTDSASGAHKELGLTIKAASDSDAVARVRLNQYQPKSLPPPT